MAAITLGLCSPLGAHAETATDLGTVGSQGGEVGVSAVAPSKSSLSATQPQAVIDKSFFEDAKSPVSDYTGIAVIAPGVSGGISANGPGLSETKNTLRGFKDGEYNVTYDDIPFGDTNGPTHHSTSYFPASIIDHVTVERGPGNASAIGQATFGGSVNLYSLVPTSEFSFSPFVSTGSWNTQLAGATVNTGTLDALGGSKMMVTAQDLSSDGYLTNSRLGSKNVTVKYEQPIGSKTLLTFFSSNNSNFYYQSDGSKGITEAQAAIYGKNFGLSSDPSKALYYGYGRVEKSTAFDYIRLQSDLGSDWGIDNTSYYVWYGNNTLSADGSSPDTGLGGVYNTQGGKIGPATQMPGYIKLNQYSIYGNVLKVTKQTDAGLFRTGLWFETTDTFRSRYDYNLFGMTPNYKEKNVLGIGSNILYDQGSSWRNYQPFAEFEWAATDNLKITPGIKLMRWQQSIDAAVLDKAARQPANIDNEFNATLPFFTVNYKIDKTSSVYAQYAQGMLVPDISYYYSPSYNKTDIKPQTSTNYQVGYVHKSSNITFDADLYYIDFANKLTQDLTSVDPVYYNGGGVVYKGIEGQVAYAVGSGFSLYTNGSINSAKNRDTGLVIANAPETTAALALLYNDNTLTSSLVYKYVGKQFADASELLSINPYTTLDYSIGYTIKNPGLGVKKMKLNLGVYNIMNNKDVITASMTSKSGPSAADLFTWQPERSLMATLRLEY
ncbi:MAG: TonB-dependent receptor [Chlorobiales bacterium]|nr:TonB-dependent receptor [Chlorobiales bacterium]